MAGCPKQALEQSTAQVVNVLSSVPPSLEGSHSYAFEVQIPEVEPDFDFDVDHLRPISDPGVLCPCSLSLSTLTAPK